MKREISIPDELFRAANRAAKRLGMSHSEFYQCAISSFLERLREDVITGALNAIYKTDRPLGVDPVLARMQQSTVQSAEW